MPVKVTIIIESDDKSESLRIETSAQAGNGNPLFYADNARRLAGEALTAALELLPASWKELKA